MRTDAMRLIRRMPGPWLVAAALWLAGPAAHAATAVTSCDGTYRAQASRPGWITITKQSGKPAAIRISHQIEGGSFSPNDGYLALYGIPAHADPQASTSNLLTLYQLDEQPRTIIRRAFDARIRSADFSADGKFLAISTRLGVEVLNFKRRQFEHHNAAYTPDFPLAVCKKGAAQQTHAADGKN